MSKDVRESLIAIGGAALFFVAAWVWFQISARLALPSWLPFAAFLAATAALLIALWRRGRTRRGAKPGDPE